MSDEDSFIKVEKNRCNTDKNVDIINVNAHVLFLSLVIKVKISGATTSITSNLSSDEGIVLKLIFIRR